MFQNFPNSTFLKWCMHFNENLKERNVKNFLFGDNSLSNNFFIKSILSNKVFINIFMSNNMVEEFPLIEDNIKKYCENLLIKGAFSECKIDLFSEKYKDLVLRDFNLINIKDMFDEYWQFYFKNKPNLFYKIPEYYNSLPFSYIWSLFFTEKDAQALVLDELVKKNSYLIGKNINLNFNIIKNVKYKIIYLDAMGKRININDYLKILDQNGLLLLRNLEIEGPNMVGWRDLRGRMMGIIKV